MQWYLQKKKKKETIIYQKIKEMFQYLFITYIVFIFNCTERNLTPNY